MSPGRASQLVALALIYPYTPGWRVVRPIRLAVLDLAATARIGRHPEVVAALVGRAMDRSRRIAGNHVRSQLGSVEHRVLLALWHMSDIWGRVGPRGIVLPVPLTHGMIVGARRPSVTAALGQLAEKGLVCPDDVGGFRLTASRRRTSLCCEGLRQASGPASAERRIWAVPDASGLPQRLLL